MTEIEKIIKKNIKSNGTISIEEYMTIALYHPKYGYYAKSDIIGKHGDFITSPEISQVFGELIATWLVFNSSIFFKYNFNILELGPGRAVLIQDILRTIKSLNTKLYDKIQNIYFLEKSKALKSYQRKINKSKVILDINQIENKETFVLANEFFDAIPINQYIKIGETWHEKRIHLDDKGNFSFIVSKSPVTKKLPFPSIAKEGFVFEYSNYACLLLSQIFEKINNNGGAFLIIDYAKSLDYGKNTLSFIYKHTHVSPFYCPGNTDISSKPDFNLIKSLAIQANCKVLGPFSQNYFLTKLGIEIRFEKLIEANPNLSSSLLASKKRLIDNEYMGDIFKIIIITNKNNKDLIFDNYD